jgi:hypothetical protein
MPQYEAWGGRKRVLRAFYRASGSRPRVEAGGSGGARVEAGGVLAAAAAEAGQRQHNWCGSAPVPALRMALATVA